MQRTQDSKNRFLSTTLEVVIGIGFACSSTQAAPPVDLITNGGFETGDFTGWTVVPGVFGASYKINDGTYDPFSPGGPLPPINGGFDAIGDQFGPSETLLQQTISVPSGVFSASLTWNDRIRNFAGLYLDPGQEFRVLILDSSNILLQEAFSTNSGDALSQVGPNSRSSDLTAILQAYAGQNVVVSIETQAQFFFHTITVDDVKLLVSTLPVTKDDCKKDDWETFVNVNTGVQIFKNQGDCVSFVATKGKNPPAKF